MAHATRIVRVRLVRSFVRLVPCIVTSFVVYLPTTTARDDLVRRRVVLRRESIVYGSLHLSYFVLTWVCSWVFTCSPWAGE